MLFFSATQKPRLPSNVTEDWGRWFRHPLRLLLLLRLVTRASLFPSLVAAAAARGPGAPRGAVAAEKTSTR